MSIPRRTDRAMVRSMCGAKLMDQRNTDELMNVLRLGNIVDNLAKASCMRWFGHVLSRDKVDAVMR